MAEPADRDPVRVFAGWALVTVGALILGLSGLCTLFWVGWGVFSVVWTHNSAGNVISMLPLTLIFGGVPMSAGFGLWRLGASLRRPKPPPSAPPPS